MFDFYEVVRIISKNKKNSSYLGKEGYVNGKVFENDDHENGAILAYGVYLFDDEIGVTFYADDMVSLDKFVDPDYMMSGEIIRVRNENGKGVIVNDND